jgi:predicted HAD superfamily Cof-like phosphohydrolase
MFEQVSAWDDATGGDAPLSLRFDVMEEEWLELLKAIDDNDLVEIADACADLVWTVLLYAKGHDIPFDGVWAEVLRSNNAKIGPDGHVLRRADGKILKPEGWTAPDIAGVLASA